MRDYLYFMSGTHYYAVAKEDIQQILCKQDELAKLPYHPAYCDGLIAIQNHVYACLDLETLYFHKQAAAIYLILLMDQMTALKADCLLNYETVTDAMWEPCEEIENGWFIMTKDDKKINLVTYELLQVRGELYDQNE